MINRKKEENILDLNFFNGESLLSIASSSKSLLKIKSDFMTESISMSLDSPSFTTLEFVLTTNHSSDSAMLEVLKDDVKINGERRLHAFEKQADKRIRVFKPGGGAKIKNFVHFTEPPKQIVVILPHTSYNWLPFAFLGDGSINNEVVINPPMDLIPKKTISQYTQASRHAVIKNQLYIFGGDHTNQGTQRVLNTLNLID